MIDQYREVQDNYDHYKENYQKWQADEDKKKF